MKDRLRKHHSIIAYLIFGLLTTAVNWCVYFPLFYSAGLSATVSNCISWFCAVLFAFVTNKPFVFRSTDWKLRTTFFEFLRFLACRLTSGLVETGILFLTVDVLSFNGIFWKLIAGSLVIVLNYIGSKLFVFEK